MAVARAGRSKPVNKADGSVRLPLGDSPQGLDLYIQDNNSLAGGKTNYRLTVFFEDGTSAALEIPAPNRRPGS